MSNFVTATTTKIDNTIFSLSGGREVVHENRAKELIELANITDYDQVTTIRLSNKSITEKAAEILSAVLKKFKNISNIDISDIIAGRPEDEALKTLTWICKEGLSHTVDNLIVLNVSDNALGVKGINTFECLLSGEKLQVSCYFIFFFLY